MENLLRKQLARIRRRAIWLRQRAEERDAAAARPPVPESAREQGQEIVDEVVATGAVVRVADFHPLRTLEKRRPWRSGGDAAGDPLERFKEGEAAPLEQLVPGSEWFVEGRPFYLIRPTGVAIDPEAASQAESFARTRRWPDDVSVSRVGARHAAVPHAGLVDPARVLFLDIETGGLSANTYMFLCGMMFLEDGEFVVEQAFARNYAEEEGCLRHVRATFDRFDVVVTYNGASFDLPFVRTRMAIHRIPEVRPFLSVDLLYTARRAFRDVLPNRRLLTVECYLRGFERTGDIPGRLIPEAWHDYVHTGDGRLMQKVLYHNRMDLFAMAILINRLAVPQLGL